MFQNLAVAMDGERGSGAALRRRERRLRAWQRHVRTAVQLALAEKLHHSANKVEPHDALRGQNKRAGREEVENVTRGGLRAQKSPPPGVRPGSLVDPGPQRSDRTVRRSSGKVPLLVVASLADASADGVDAATLSFLTASALEARRREEEEEKEKKRKVVVEVLARAQERVRDGLPLSSAEDAAWRQWSGLPPKQEKRRKRKKRKKRRLPRTSSLPGRARRRHRQWHVSLRHVVDVPVVRFVLFPQVLISSNDEICADNYIYYRFKLIGKGRSEQWEVFLYCDKTIKMTVIARKCCPGVCLRLALCRLRFFTLLGNGLHHL